MWTSVKNKVFIFVSLVLISAALLISFFNARLVIRESETYLFEILANRSQINALTADSELKERSPLNKIASKNNFVFVKSDGTIVGSLNPLFSSAQILAMKAPGSIVTPCQGLDNERYYCALTALKREGVWLFDYVPATSLFQVFQKIRAEIAIVVFLVILFSLIVSYLLVSKFLSPLKQFANAASEVAKGNYSADAIPLASDHEFKALHSAFEKMIHELKIRERNLELGALKLAHSARLATVGQMGASIAHEVKNPLMAMQGYAKIVLQKADTPELKEAAEILVKEGDRCSSILKTMLKFSRDESSEPKPLVLQEIIQAVVLLTKGEARSRQVTIKTTTETSPVVMGSGQQLQQALLNLLMNAIDASEIGGEITLRTFENGKTAQIEVEDHGAGVPVEIQEKIFEPFFTTKTKEGTGLGLSITKQIIEDHQGRLLLRSRPQQTIFKIELPLP